MPRRGDKTKMFRVRISKALDERLAKAAKEHGLDKSKFARVAIEAAIQDPDFINPLIDLAMDAITKKLRKYIDPNTILKVVE